MLLLVLVLLATGAVRGSDDPAPILYPGQVNIGLLADIHRGGDGGECGPLRPRAVQRAMAAVWAAHQANFDNPHALNIGVYIYDTCGRDEVARRQAYRLLGHVTNECSEKNAPPLVAVIVDGVSAPLQLLSAFSVPVITATGTPDIASGILSTAPSAPALARGGVSVLHKLHLLEVAVVAGDEDSLFAHFSAQVAHVTGMQATHVQDGAGTDTTDDDTLATLNLISLLYGKSRLKAVVFLVSSEEAVSLLQMVDDTNSPKIPWLVITPESISTRLTSEQGKRLRKVLLLSPESPPSLPFHDYFRRLLKEEETIKYHPLLQEYAASDHNNNSDVSPVSRAVWFLSSALSELQGRSCRSCPPSRAEVGRALLHQGFDREGALSSLRYALHGFAEDGATAELGFYSDDEGLSVEPAEVLSPFSVEEEEESGWKILDDTTLRGASDLLQKNPDVLEDEAVLQSVSPLEDSPSNMMRSVSLHQGAEEEEHATLHEGAPPVRRALPLSAWLGRPWSLAVLGTSALVALSALYALVFLLVKACEGGGGECWLPVLQLVGLVWMCAGAALHTWKPAPLVCGLRRVVHNTGIVSCYAGLLLKGMSLRSRSVVGLGGRVDRCGQLLTLLSLVGVQVAVEAQWWLLHPPAVGAQLECVASKRETLASLVYPAILLATAAAVALTTRRLPYSQSESRALICTSLACALLFACWGVSCWLLPSLPVAAPSALLATALAVLLGLFLPHLVSLHRHGHKPLSPHSYADSLSTVFTMFNNNNNDNDTLTSSSRGRRKAKTPLDYQDIP